MKPGTLCEFTLPHSLISRHSALSQGHFFWEVLHLSLTYREKVEVDCRSVVGTVEHWFTDFGAPRSMSPSGVHTPNMVSHYSFKSGTLRWQNEEGKVGLRVDDSWWQPTTNDVNLMLCILINQVKTKLQITNEIRPSENQTWFQGKKCPFLPCKSKLEEFKGLVIG